MRWSRPPAASRLPGSRAALATKTGPAAGAGRGGRTPQVCKKLGVSQQTYYRWRKEYGRLRLDQAKRLKTLEQENARLKRLVADQALDNAILKEVASGKF